MKIYRGATSSIAGFLLVFLPFIDGRSTDTDLIFTIHFHLFLETTNPLHTLHTYLPSTLSSTNTNETLISQLNISTVSNHPQHPLKVRSTHRPSDQHYSKQKRLQIFTGRRGTFLSSAEAQRRGFSAGNETSGSECRGS